jgi:hypothetical protein
MGLAQLCICFLTIGLRPTGRLTQNVRCGVRTREDK